MPDLHFLNGFAWFLAIATSSLHYRRSNLNARKADYRAVWYEQSALTCGCAHDRDEQTHAQLLLVVQALPVVTPQFHVLLLMAHPVVETFKYKLSPLPEIKPKCSKGEKEYYEKQVEIMMSFEEIDSLGSNSQRAIDEEQNHEECQYERAIKFANWENIFLLAFKIFATIESRSLAIAASTIHSVLDLMAGFILWITHWFMKKTNIYKYPIGKLRVQPVGIIIFATVMATLGLQVLEEALEQLVQDGSSEKMSRMQLFWLYSIMLIAAGVKFFLWIYCRSSGSKIVRANAKVNIVLPEDMPLREAHEIGESLQVKLEQLEEVERSFVHLDHDCNHKSEHSVRTKLPDNQP